MATNTLKRATFSLDSWDTVPEELRQLPQWIVWKLEQRPGAPKPTKVPYNPRTGMRASSIAPNTWAEFDVARRAVWNAGEFDGIGFVLTADDPYTGFDIDGCRNAETGELTTEARELIAAFDSYAEVSPSGTGIHVLMRGAVPSDAGHRRGDYEAYSTERYFTVTGQHLDGTPTEVRDAQDVLTETCRRLFPRPTPPELAAEREGENLDDAEILRRGAKDAKFTRLWNGDLGEHDGNHSSADAALCAKLAFYTRDPLQIDRLFRQSGLMRDKWDDRRGGSTYGEGTIQRALEFQRDFHSDRPALPVDLVTRLPIEPPLPSSPPPARAPRFNLLTEDDLDHLPPPRWLVSGILPEASLSEIWGDYGTGKSFFALDLALSVQTGRAWQGHKVQHGDIIYVAGEGARGIRKRIKAWKQQNHIFADTGIHVIDRAVQLRHAEDYQGLIEDLRALDIRPLMIVIDTLARSTVGMEENSAKEMGEAVAVMELIKRTFGCTVLIVHHSGKNGLSSRGSVALGGAVEAEIQVSLDKQTKIVTLTCHKQKDAGEFPPLNFRLDTVELTGEYDDEGLPVTSCVLVDDAAAQRASLVRNENEVAILEALEAFGADGATNTELEKESGLSATTFKRALQALLAKGLIAGGGARGARYHSTKIDITRVQQAGVSVVPNEGSKSTKIGSKVGSSQLSLGIDEDGIEADSEGPISDVDPSWTQVDPRQRESRVQGSTTLRVDPMGPKTSLGPKTPCIQCGSRGVKNIAGGAGLCAEHAKAYRDDEDDMLAPCGKCGKSGVMAFAEVGGLACIHCLPKLKRGLKRAAR